MLLKSLKYILATTFFLSINVITYSDELIKPKKKPTLQLNNTTNKSLSSFIIPVKKPESRKKSIKKDEENLEKRITKINGVIIPKNKPLIVKKERLRKVKKSKYYSDRDLSYAKQECKRFLVLLSV